MHQPLAVADEEGVRFIDREVVHRLRVNHNRNRLDCAVAVKRHDFIADFEVAGVHPLARSWVRNVPEVGSRMIRKNR